MKANVIVLLIFWVIYLALSLLAPAPTTTFRYGLNVTQLNLVRLTVMIPLLFIWLTALFSIVRFKVYGQFVQHSPEGIAYKKITRGLWMLLFVVVVPSLISAISNFYPSSSQVLQVSTILRNYVTVVFYFLGFWYLWQGSEDLIRTIPGAAPKPDQRNYVLAVIAGLVLVYMYFVFNNVFRTESLDPLVRPTYYLPDALIFTTIIVPYALTWALGGLAILNFRAYSKTVPGHIYRDTFGSVALGLTFTICILIALQFLTQANAYFSHAEFRIILIIVYLLLFAIAVGYLLIARGARKLAAIEEVE